MLGTVFTAREPRIRAAAIVIAGSFAYTRYWERGESEEERARRRAAAEATDPAFFAAAIAPRPFLMVNTTDDPDLSARRGRDALRSGTRAEGAALAIPAPTTSGVRASTRTCSASWSARCSNRVALEDDPVLDDHVDVVDHRGLEQRIAVDQHEVGAIAVADDSEIRIVLPRHEARCAAVAA